MTTEVTVLASDKKKHRAPGSAQTVKKHSTLISTGEVVLGHRSGWRIWCIPYGTFGLYRSGPSGIQ